MKFSPRIGLAYELHKGTVIRGGFGIFYAPVATVTDTTGYSQTTYSAPTGNVTAPSAVGFAARHCQTHMAVRRMYFRRAATPWAV